MIISGKTKVLGLIGDPVEHTLSPVIHNTIAECISEDEASNTVYVPFRVEGSQVAEAVKGAFALDICGLNVTVPHKSAVIPFLDDIDPMAKEIGACNTLVRTKNGYKGYNTDAEGIIRELSYYGVDVENKVVVVLGAGGASRAVVYGLASKKPAKIYLANRTIQKAEEIAFAVNTWLKNELVHPLTIDEVKILDEKDFIVIQCTSVGLAPNADDCIIEDGEFFDRALVGVDIIYKPFETVFMKRFRQRGKQAYNGLLMLLFQGIAAYELFTGVKLSKKTCAVTMRALEREAQINRPIILTGYMGSGKTSVGKKLSELYGFEMLDTDELIVKNSGMSISEIFEKYGEEYFRNLETDTIRSLSGCLDKIISLGGGLVMRAENREILKGIGTVIYLRAKSETIYDRVKDDKGRPLLQDSDVMGKINSMLKVRGPVYEECADIVIDTDGRELEDIAREIADYTL